MVEVSSFHLDYNNAILDKGNIAKSIHDMSNGTHSVKLFPTVEGVHSLSVTIDGSHIKESPFLLRVEPGETDPSSSILLEEIIEGVTGRELSLELQAMDTNGNKRHKGGDEILVVMIPLSGEELEEILCRVEYFIDGRYSISCPAASHAGEFLLHVEIVTSSGDATPIKSSPFRATIYPGHATPETTEVISGGSITSRAGVHIVKFTSKAGLYSTFLV